MGVYGRTFVQTCGAAWTSKRKKIETRVRAAARVLNYMRPGRPCTPTSTQVGELSAQLVEMHGADKRLTRVASELVERVKGLEDDAEKAEAKVREKVTRATAGKTYIHPYTPTKLDTATLSPCPCEVV